MKKITGLLLSMAMVFTLAACGSKVDESAIDAFEEAITNVSKMESSNFSIEMKQSKDELANNFSIEGTFINKNKNPQASISVNTQIEGEKQEGMIKLFLNEGTMYVNFADIAKQKQTLDLSMLSSLDMTTTKKGTLKTQIKKYLKSAKMKDDTITFEFDTKEDIMKNALKNNSNALMSAYKDVEIKKLNMEMKVKDKVMNKLTLDLGMKSEEQSFDMTITFSFKNINKAKEIVFPDFSDYVESNATNSMLGL